MFKLITRLLDPLEESAQRAEANKTSQQKKHQGDKCPKSHGHQVLDNFTGL